MKKLVVFAVVFFLSFPIFPQSSAKLNSISNKRSELASVSYRYKATILSSNFSIPLVKFSRFQSNMNGSTGDVSFFNSVGAGLSIAGGEISEVRDPSGKIINQDFTPTFGATFGFLFSSASLLEERQNSFAPFVGISILDFQIGLGWELGSVPDSYKRSFFTVSYNIPIYKLKRGGFYILRSGDFIDDSSFGNYKRLGN